MDEAIENKESQEVKQVKQVESKPARDEHGRLLPGNTANPKGRPKGKTLKEFARDFLMSMSDGDKREFLNGLSKDVVWRMAEGNPHQTSDVTSGDEPIPFMTLDELRKNNSNNESSEPKKED